MEHYLHRLIDRQHDAGQEAGSYHAFHLIYDNEWVEQSQSILDKALAAATTEDDRTRVGLFVHNLHMLRLYLQYHAATRSFDFAEAKRLARRDAGALAAGVRPQHRLRVQQRPGIPEALCYALRREGRRVFGGAEPNRREDP
jgi:hypothetical protein